MAQNITLMGASYSDVPAVELPKTGGGTAKFTDVTDTTALAGNVLSTKYFYTKQGVRTQGTATEATATVSSEKLTLTDGFPVAVVGLTRGFYIKTWYANEYPASFTNEVNIQIPDLMLLDDSLVLTISTTSHLTALWELPVINGTCAFSIAQTDSTYGTVSLSQDSTGCTSSVNGNIFTVTITEDGANVVLLYS